MKCQSRATSEHHHRWSIPTNTRGRNPMTDAVAGEVDPDQLLRHCHQALSMNNAALLAISFATLDKYLATGGDLPTRWQRSLPQPTYVTAVAQPGGAGAGGAGGSVAGGVVVLNAAENITITDKRGRRAAGGDQQ